MAPGRKRGAKGLKTKSELSTGDLVLAKVKGYPAWPAKISKPEDWERAPDPKKYFVQFFGTSEIAFVAPADIQAFNSDAKNKLSARCKGKNAKFFAEAVKEICEEFELLQHTDLCSMRDDNNTQDLASETHSVDPVVDKASESRNCGTDKEGPNCQLEIKQLSDVRSGLKQCSQREGEVECQDVKPCLSDDMNHCLSPDISLVKKSGLSTDPSNLVKESVLVSSLSSHSFLKKEDSDGGQIELANGNQPKRLAVGLKRKHEDRVHGNSVLTMSPEHVGDRVQEDTSSGSLKASSVDNIRLGLDFSSERKGKMLLKDKKYSDAADYDRPDDDLNFKEHKKEISKNKMKAKQGCEKQTSRVNEAPRWTETPNCADTKDGASVLIAQTSGKDNSGSPVVLDVHVNTTESEMLISGVKAENQMTSRMHPSTNHSYNSSNEDDAPSTKCRRRVLEAMSSSALISENRSRNSASRKNGTVHPNKEQSPVMQSTKKRRAVRLCDDDEDELPKTPVHGGFTSKGSVIPHSSDSKKKIGMPGESNVSDPLALRNRGVLVDGLKDQVQSTRVPNKPLSTADQQRMPKRPREAVEHISPSLTPLHSEKSVSVESKQDRVTPKRSPQSIAGTRPSAEPQNKHSVKATGNISHKKVTAGGNRGLATAHGRATSYLNLSISEGGKPTSSGEKRKTTAKPDTLINDSIHVVQHPDKKISSLGERLDAGQDNKISFPVGLKVPDTATSMKHLIAAAQARKKQTHMQNSCGVSLPLLVPDAYMPGGSPSLSHVSLAVESSNRLQLDGRGMHPKSPASNIGNFSSIDQHENEEIEERVSSERQMAWGSLSEDTEAAVARDAFEGMIETLSRTKESIGRATRLAIDCAKYGIANEVVELLIRKLEDESNNHRKVDLFFLVDSITQCSHSQKGIAGASYIPIVEAALPRLIGAAAPPGSGAQENRRQCHKVLRLWLERKILPESVLRRYMDDIGATNDDTSACLSLRRPSRAERAIDDPIREMEGMLVDEYGSNATFQLPGFLVSHVFEEEEEEDDLPTNLSNEVADTSVSRHTPANKDPENYTVTPNDRRHCILEDVDGELEMEDVSGHQRDGRPLLADCCFELASVEQNSDVIFESSPSRLESLDSPEGSPPLPPGSPPVTPPLPTSPPPSSQPPPPALLSQSPPLPPLPHPQPCFLMQYVFPPPPVGGPPPPVGPPPPPTSPPPPPLDPPPPPVGPPPFPTQQSLPLQPVLMSQHMVQLPSAISTSPPLAYQPPALLHETDGPSTGNQPVSMVSNTHGSHIDAPVRTEVFSQQSSFYPPAAVSKGQHCIAYSSSRPVEYGKGDAYMNPVASQHRNLLMPGTAPCAERPLHSEPPSQHKPSHFSYPNSAQQHQYPLYSLPKFSDGQRRYATDEQSRMQVNEFIAEGQWGQRIAGERSCFGPPYSQEGYFGPPPERHHANAVNFQHSASNSRPAATPNPVHGAPMMPPRPDMSAINWRPT